MQHQAPTSMVLSPKTSYILVSQVCNTNILVEIARCDHLLILCRYCFEQIHPQILLITLIHVVHCSVQVLVVLVHLYVKWLMAVSLQRFPHLVHSVLVGHARQDQYWAFVQHYAMVDGAQVQHRLAL